MNRPDMPKGTPVTPQQFGAKADGKTDDIQALRLAVEAAKQSGAPLELPEGEYYTSTTWDLGDVTVLSRNARISYHGKEFNRPAVDMYDNVNIFGTFHVDSVELCDIRADHPPYHTHGNRCAVAFGNYDNGRGAHHCYIEDIVIWGSGMTCGNGMLLTGDSSDLRFDKITVPKGHKHVNVPAMIHWGNYIEHHPRNFDPADAKDGYAHEPNAGLTTHPHDISIGLIDSYADNATFYISAGYDITIDEVRSYDAEHAIAIVHGDVGFLYASEEERAHGMRNLHIKKVYGENLRSWGSYIQVAQGYEDDPDLGADITIDEMVLKASENNQGNGACFYGVKNCEIGRLELEGFTKQCMQLGYANKNIHIGELTMKNFRGDGFYAYAQGKVWDRIYPHTENVRIDSLTLSVRDDLTNPIFNIGAINTFKIGKMKMV